MKTVELKKSYEFYNSSSEIKKAAEIAFGSEKLNSLLERINAEKMWWIHESALCKTNLIFKNKEGESDSSTILLEIKVESKVKERDAEGNATQYPIITFNVASRHTASDLSGEIPSVTNLIEVDVTDLPTNEGWVEFSVDHQMVHLLCRYISDRYDRVLAAEYDGIFIDAYRLLKPKEGTFALKDGKFAIGQYKKYEPCITFISPMPEVFWESKGRENFNLPQGSIEVIYGTLFKSKKGTLCFRIQDYESATHILIRDYWGGSFNRYRGGTLPKEESLYYKTRSSNGGGEGYDYAVYPKDWKYEMSEEDL